MAVRCTPCESVIVAEVEGVSLRQLPSEATITFAAVDSQGMPGRTIAP